MKISHNLIRRVFVLISPFLLAATMGKCLILQFGGIRVVFCFDAPPTEINAYGWGDFDDYEKVDHSGEV